MSMYIFISATTGSFVLYAKRSCLRLCRQCLLLYSDALHKSEIKMPKNLHRSRSTTTTAFPSENWEDRRRKNRIGRSDGSDRMLMVLMLRRKENRKNVKTLRWRPYVSSLLSRESIQRASFLYIYTCDTRRTLIC